MARIEKTRADLPGPSAPAGLLSSHILNVHVSPKTHVVSQVPAIVVGIFVDHDVVPTPVPITAEAHIIRGDTEIEATEPKSARPASREMPDVSAAKTAGKTTVLKRMVHVIVRI